MTTPHHAFSQRLQQALDAAGVPAGRRRNAAVMERYGVSREAARKWLNGLALPELERMIEIASDTGVAFEWLATGRGAMRPDSLAVREAIAPAYGEVETRQLLTLITAMPLDKRRALIALLRN